MTERERWTVYPLLFLSLGIAMRSHITSSLELHEMSCDTLKSRTVKITDENDRVRLVLTALRPGDGGGGAIQIFSEEGKPEVVLRALTHGGLVELISAEGIKQVVLGVAPPGGFVETIDNQGRMVRALAVSADPRVRVIVAPPPAPAPEKPSSETPAPESATPPAVDEPAGEKTPGTGDEPAEKAADR